MMDYCFLASSSLFSWQIILHHVSTGPSCASVYVYVYVYGERKQSGSADSKATQSQTNTKAATIATLATSATVPESGMNQ